MKKILYISLTGMIEPLGRSQVLEYIIDLSKENMFYLISFERENDIESIDEIKELIKKYDIEWHYFIYSNKYGIFSTIGQIYKVFRLSVNLIKKESIQIIHARSMIPATIGIILKKLYGVKLLFDIRGFAIDEKLDSGRLREKSLLYKSLKFLDNYLYKASDHIVTLTHKAKEILNKNLHIPNERMTIIPTCANKELFKVLDEGQTEAFKTALEYKPEDKIIIHTGTVSGWYDFEKEIILVKELMQLDSCIHFLILNKNEHNFINNLVDKHQIPSEKVKVLSSSFNDIHKYLNIANVALFFIKPSYSKQASAPTKFAENVACYLPSITNSGVGDMEYYMKRYDVGYLIDLDSFENNITNIAKEVLLYLKNYEIKKDEYDRLFSNYFDKKMAVEKYQSIYDVLVNKL